MKISIIIPVYNVAPYIEYCLKSVMLQTYKGNMECLLVDDCGRDDSMAIAERMISVYTGPIQFRILHHDHNRGLSAARNTGTEAATGDYIFYLDGDDEITDDCIEKLAKPIINDQSIEMVMGNRKVNFDGIILSMQYQNGIRLQEKDVISSETVRTFFFNSRKLSKYAWNKLIRKVFLIQNQLYFKEGILYEDNLWSFYVVKYLCHLYVIPDITYIQHKRPNSITTGTSEKEKLSHKIMIYDEIASNFTIGDKQREAKHYLKQICTLCAKTPDNKELLAISMIMMEALGDSYLFDKFLFSITLFLSKFSAGRKLFMFANRIRGKLKGRYC